MAKTTPKTERAAGTLHNATAQILPPEDPRSWGGTAGTEKHPKTGVVPADAVAEVESTLADEEASVVAAAKK